MIQKGQGRDLDTFTAMGQIPRSTERILVLNIFSFALKVIKICRISVVMYVSDQFVDGNLQLTGY